MKPKRPQPPLTSRVAQSCDTKPCRDIPQSDVHTSKSRRSKQGIFCVGGVGFFVREVQAAKEGEPHNDDIDCQTVSLVAGTTCQMPASDGNRLQNIPRDVLSQGATVCESTVGVLVLKIAA